MTTERRIDVGDATEVLRGSPTWDNPMNWQNRWTEPKPNTPAANRATIESRARNALADNTAFLSLGTLATTAQNADQIKALTRQINGVIRLLLGELNGTD